MISQNGSRTSLPIALGLPPTARDPLRQPNSTGHRIDFDGFFRDRDPVAPDEMGDEEDEEEPTRPTRRNLFDVFEREHAIKLPMACVREAGPAAQTFGGLLVATSHQTFMRIGRIAEFAGVPEATARKHLARLDALGWVSRHGRQRTRGGTLRRTATHALTPHAKKHLAPYGMLFLGTISFGGQKLSWSARAVWSLVTSRLYGKKRWQEDADLDTGDLQDHLTACIDHQYKDFRWSLAELQRLTGLDRKSLVGAKRELGELRLIRWIEGGDGRADLLIPNVALRFIWKADPAKPGWGWRSLEIEEWLYEEVMEDLCDD